MPSSGDRLIVWLCSVLNLLLDGNHDSKNETSRISPAMSAPVRLYLLHHPDSRLAGRLADRVYEWFRLPGLEGIPLYLRSRPVKGRKHPLPPDGKPEDKRVQYFIPLIDAHMVRDPAWHNYLAKIAEQCARNAGSAAEEWGWRMYPVALDSTAFNLPEAVSRLNFIRFGLTVPPAQADPNQATEEEARARSQWEETESQNVLKHLTEAFARDLNGRVFPEQAGSRFQIFISYARADSTEEAKALRNYIQGQTQCLVFFDENDIGFGQAFGESLEQHAGQHSKALIVIHSDHYAERPWCRWEIDRFSEPRTVKSARRPDIHVFHPILVVENMRGTKVSRVVPELGHCPVVRWEEGRQTLIFSTLMREVVMGLRDVLTARLMKWNAKNKGDLVVNRLPGPVTLARLLRVSAPDGTACAKYRVVHYPGYGLPMTELRLLEKTFPEARFRAFSDLSKGLPTDMDAAFDEMKKAPDFTPPLREKVIVISTAHHRTDLAERGLLPQSQDEAMIHLLRPLVRLGADLLYGGLPPKRGMEAEAENLAARNITLTLMRLLGAERTVDLPEKASAQALKRRPSMPVLFNLSAWPACEGVTVADEASWINVCRVKRVLPQDAGLSEWRGTIPGPFASGEMLPPGLRRHRALTASAMRRMLAQGFSCEVPGRKTAKVKPAACVFMGGNMERFQGVMPGLFEEFLNVATAAERALLFLIGGLGGAAHVLATALLTPRTTPPKELTVAFYQGENAANGAEYDAMWAELTDGERARVTDQFSTLWSLIQSAHEDGLTALLNNGLDEADNHQLLTTTNTVEAVQLVWKGISRTLLKRS